MIIDAPMEQGQFRIAGSAMLSDEQRRGEACLFGDQEQTITIEAFGYRGITTIIFAEMIFADQTELRLDFVQKSRRWITGTLDQQLLEVSWRVGFRRGFSGRKYRPGPGGVQPVNIGVHLFPMPDTQRHGCNGFLLVQGWGRSRSFRSE